MTSRNIPPLFKRKVVLDKVFETIVTRPVVTLEEYKKIREDRLKTYIECEKVYYPSRHEK